MKLICTKSEVLTHLNKLITITEKGIEENYAYITLLAEENRVQLAAQDDQILVFLTAENVKVEKAGKIRIHASTLFELVKRLPQDQFSICVIDNNFKISLAAKDFQANFQGLEFQNIPILEVKPSVEFSIKGSLLRKAIYQTYFSASPSISGRIHVEGVQLSIKDNQLILNAADGRRIGFTAVKAQARNNKISIVIPRNSMYRLMQLLKNISKNVIVSISSSIVSCKTINMTFISRLLVRDYPDCEQPFQQDWKLSAIVNRLELCDSLDRVLQIKDEKIGGVLLSFSHNKLLLYSEKQGFGTTKEQLPTVFNDKDFEFRCHGESLLEILEHMDSKTIKLSFNDSSSQCLVVPEKAKNPKYLLMGLVR